MSVNVTPSRASIAVGETVQLMATVLGDGSPPQDVRWDSNDASVATVEATGLVTGVAPGAVSVTATSEFDPSVTGAANITVGGPDDGAGVVIRTPNQLLLDLGETIALEAVAYDAAGGAVTDAVIDWSSSDPAIVSVDANGVVTAEEIVGSVTITATWNGSTDSIYVLVALLTPDTVRIPRADVLAVAPTFDAVVLARTTITEALAVSDVFASNEVAGRVTSIAAAEEAVDALSVTFEPIDSLSEVFALFYLKAISEPVVIEGTISPEGMVITSSIAGVRRTWWIEPGWRCEPDANEALGDGVEWEFIKGTYDFRWETEFEFELGIDTVWKWWGVIPYPDIDYHGMRAVLSGGPHWNIQSPGIRVESAVQGAIDCYYSVAVVATDIFSLAGFLHVNGSLQPRFGFEAAVDVEGEFMIMGPTLRDGYATLTVGVAHDPDDGFEWIADADASLGKFEPIGGMSLDAEAAFEASPYLSASVGLSLSAVKGGWVSVDVHLAEPKLYLTLDGSLGPQIHRSLHGYRGPEWALTYGLKTDLKFEIVGGAAKVLEWFGIPTEHGRRTFDVWGPVLWAESPKPTVTAEASHAITQARHEPYPAAARASSSPPTILFASEVPKRYEGDRVEFWGFADGATTCSWLTQGVVDGQGVATATWQPGPNDAGEYAVRAHLHSGALGRINLPYPSPSTVPVAVGAPIAVDDEVSLLGPVYGPYGPAEVPIAVLANDLNLAGGILRIIAVTQPDHWLQGSVRHTDELVYYTFGGSTDLTVRFEYTIENDAGLRDSATVSVRINSLRAENPQQDWGISTDAIGILTQINATGDAIATGCDVYRSCTTRFRSSDGSFVNLGTLGGWNSAALGLNDHAVVVGWSHAASQTRRPFIWDSIGGMRDLGTGPDANREGVATAISNDGHIVGAVGGLDLSSIDRLDTFHPDDTARPGRAVMWREGVFIDLHDALETRLGREGRSIATGVTDGDPIPVVVGTYYQYFPRENEPFCFMWTDANQNDRAEAGEVIVLPSLGGTACRIHDINERGLVVGVSTDAKNVIRPFLWSPPEGIRALAQPAGGTDGVARAVNVHGLVVGDQIIKPTDHGGLLRVPLYWAGDAVAMPSNIAGLPSGWVLESLNDINDHGDMIGVARTPGDDLRAILIRVGSP